MIITDQEINYLTETHYKPSDTGKLDKFHNKKEIITSNNSKSGSNGLNIVAVRVIYENPTNISSWIPFYNRIKVYHLFIIELQNDNQDTYYIAKSYQNFKTLHNKLKKNFLVSLQKYIYLHIKINMIMVGKSIMIKNLWPMKRKKTPLVVQMKNIDSRENEIIITRIFEIVNENP